MKYFTELTVTPKDINQKIQDYLNKKRISARELPRLFSILVKQAVSDHKKWFLSNFDCFMGEADDIKKIFLLNNDRDELFLQTDIFLVQIDEFLKLKTERLNQKKFYKEAYSFLNNELFRCVMTCGATLGVCLTCIACCFQEKLLNGFFLKIIEDYDNYISLDSDSNTSMCPLRVEAYLYSQQIKSNIFPGCNLFFAGTMLLGASIYLGANTFFNIKKINNHLKEIDKLLEEDSDRCLTN